MLVHTSRWWLQLLQWTVGSITENWKKFQLSAETQPSVEGSVHEPEVEIKEKRQSRTQDDDEIFRDIFFVDFIKCGPIPASVFVYVCPFHITIQLQNGKACIDVVLGI